MKCQRCESSKVAEVSAKCSDMCWWRLGRGERDGYVPTGMGIGGGDYVEITYCLDCGQLQGDWPNRRTMSKAQREAAG